MASISDQFIILGYSGHAFVVLDVAKLNHLQCLGYFEQKEKQINPFKLNYLGSEKDQVLLTKFRSNGIPMFSAIGNNALRSKTLKWLTSNDIDLISICHPNASISEKTKIADAVYIGSAAIINPMSEIGQGVIVNSGAIVEHGCKIDDYAHIAPGAVLCGNVKIGKGSFIGAASVVKEGIVIGSDVIIGAGSVVVKNIPDGKTYFGNPAKEKDGR